MSSLRPHLDHFARFRAQLLSFSDVHHADLGWRYHGGERTDDVALRIFVPRKRPDGGGLAPRELRPGACCAGQRRRLVCRSPHRATLCLVGQTDVSPA